MPLAAAKCDMSVSKSASPYPRMNSATFSGDWLRRGTKYANAAALPLGGPPAGGEFMSFAFVVAKRSCAERPFPAVSIRIRRGDEIGVGNQTLHTGVRIR
jgi:hypothetical protein